MEKKKEFKKGFFELSKWKVLKITGLALTVGFALNYTKNEFIKDMRGFYESDSIQVRVAELDERTLALADSMQALVADIHDAAQRLVLVRDSLDVHVVTVPRDSVVVREKIIPVYTTIVRESTIWVRDTIQVEPSRHWEIYQAKPRVP